MKQSNDERLSQAQRPSDEAMRLHPFFRGKIQTAAKCAIRDLSDFSIWYTPGVAAPCRAIAAECGFGTIEQISRVFRRVLGQTPTQYRQQERRQEGRDRG